MRPRGHTNHRTRGTSLAEIAMAISVLTLAVTALVGTSLADTRLAEEKVEQALLTTACRNLVETLEAQEFSELTENYGTGTLQPRFWASEHGEISFTDSTDAVVTGLIELFDDETMVPSDFPSPNSFFDLNSNGSLDSGRVSDYDVLPMRLTISMYRFGGTRNVAMMRVLYEATSP